MYVKLAFAVASHLDSEIMIMDEVLAVGDVNFQKKSIEKMKNKIHEGKTVLYVSHNMSTIRDFCDRCIVLDHGKLTYDGDVEKAINRYIKISSANFKTKYSFSEKMIKNDYYGKIIFLNKFEFINKKTPVFEAEEKMCFSFGWYSKKDLNEIRMRIEIKNVDGISVGMAESKPFISCKTNDRGKEIAVFDCSNLAPGIYIMRISLFILNSNKTHTGVADTPLPIYFKINDTTKNKTNWLKQYWGNIRFNDVEILSRNK